jgi:lipopolysaccharide/colanic/teichoic acid biosynthesis glycosyltransferase
MKMTLSHWYLTGGKRALDLSLSVCALLVAVPGLMAIAAVVWLDLGWPVFFRQKRIGRHNVPFEILKFRTMRETRGADGRLLPDAQRVTPLGRFLRLTSLDELPTLVNVLRGEMSLVGPRPLLVDYLPRYTPWQAQRHLVLPGVTGWAQVNGRNLLAWEDKLALDVWYVQHLGLWVDLQILRATLWKILIQEGANLEGDESPHG